MIFDIGTRVRCVGKAAGDPVKIGDIGTVIDESNAPTVQWDRPRPGMNGNDSNIWCMTSEELEPQDAASSACWPAIYPAKAIALLVNEGDI